MQTTIIFIKLIKVVISFQVFVLIIVNKNAYIHQFTCTMYMYTVIF